MKTTDTIDMQTVMNSVYTVIAGWLMITVRLDDAEFEGINFDEIQSVKGTVIEYENNGVIKDTQMSEIRRDLIHLEGIRDQREVSAEWLEFMLAKIYGFSVEAGLEDFSFVNAGKPFDSDELKMLFEVVQDIRIRENDWVEITDDTTEPYYGEVKAIFQEPTTLEEMIRIQIWDEIKEVSFWKVKRKAVPSGGIPLNEELNDADPFENKDNRKRAWVKSGGSGSMIESDSFKSVEDFDAFIGTLSVKFDIMKATGERDAVTGKPIYEKDYIRVYGGMYHDGYWECNVKGLVEYRRNEGYGINVSGKGFYPFNLAFDAYDDIKKEVIGHLYETEYEREYNEKRMSQPEDRVITSKYEQDLEDLNWLHFRLYR